jgi:hypothetical protein
VRTCPTYHHIVADINAVVSYYVDPAAVIVRGKPSANMAARLEKDEKARLAAQVEKLGPAGIEAATKELETAKEEHDRPIPEEILTAFPVPDVKSISWISVSSVQQPGKGRAPGPAPAGEAASALEKALSHDGEELSFFVEYDHVKVCSTVYLVASRSLPAPVRLRDRAWLVLAHHAA